MRRALMLAFLAGLARSEDAAPTPDSIQRAIDRGARWLKSAQKADGGWGGCVSDRSYDGGPGGPCYRLGPTTFSLFTLAVCGVPKEDAAVQRGLKWFIEAQNDDERCTSYESSAAILMLCALNRVEAPKQLVRAKELRTRPEGSRFSGPEWMRLDERVQHLIGEDSCYARGGFGYWASARDYADVSATQFAILALRAASFAGYPVERVRPEIWSRTADYVRGLQHASGGVPYHRPHEPTRGMTAAALSTLLICREQTLLLGQKPAASLATAIDGGLRYLDANFDVAANPSEHFEGRSTYHYCHLYAIERTGMLSGRKEFGGKAWYARGAVFLLEEQQETGRWTDPTCMRPDDVLGTCFALLFLKKATIPAVTR